MSEFMYRGKPDAPRRRQRKRPAHPKVLGDLLPGDRAAVSIHVCVMSPGPPGLVLARPTRWNEECGHWVDSEPLYLPVDKSVDEVVER